MTQQQREEDESYPVHPRATVGSATNSVARRVLDKRKRRALLWGYPVIGGTQLGILVTHVVDHYCPLNSEAERVLANRLARACREHCRQAIIDLWPRAEEV